MSILADIYVAARTRNVPDADTDDLPVLVVRRGSAIVFSKQLFGGSSRVKRGAAAIWRVDVRNEFLDHADLTFELHASGNDAWSPEDVIIWGTAGIWIGQEIVIPLAASLNLATAGTFPKGGRWISTDVTEGVRIYPITPMGRGQDATRAQRVIVLAATDPYGGLIPPPVRPTITPGEEATRASLTVQAGAPGRLLMSYTLPATQAGGNLQRGEAAFCKADLAAPFSRQDVEVGAFTLSIDGSDSWVPNYFAVFGIGPEFGTPRVLIPFVATTGYPLHVMSSDTGK